MPRAPAQPSSGDEKPRAERRFKNKMRASTHPSVSCDGFAPAPSTREFDLWLQRALGRLHGDVLHEPVPERLLRIIKEAAKAGD